MTSTMPSSHHSPGFKRLFYVTLGKVPKVGASFVTNFDRPELLTLFVVVVVVFPLRCVISRHKTGYHKSYKSRIHMQK